jgi:hypothetical protein
MDGHARYALYREHELVRGEGGSGLLAGRREDSGRAGGHGVGEQSYRPSIGYCVTKVRVAKGRGDEADRGAGL